MCVCVCVSAGVCVSLFIFRCQIRQLKSINLATCADEGKDHICSINEFIGSPFTCTGRTHIVNRGQFELEMHAQEWRAFCFLCRLQTPIDSIYRFTISRFYWAFHFLAFFFFHWDQTTSTAWRWRSIILILITNYMGISFRWLRWVTSIK